MILGGVPTNGWSGGGDCKLGNLDAISDFRLAILATKKLGENTKNCVYGFLKKRTFRNPIYPL